MITRRSMLAAIPATGAAAALPTMAETVDPLLETINAYRDGWQAFLAIPEDEADAHMHLWRTPHSKLARWDRGCVSYDGAVEALRTAIMENEGGDSLLTEPMMRAALAYLEGGAI